MMNSTTTLLDRPGLDRVRYFSRQLLTADDMIAEQEYFRQKLRRHNRYLHGWGVVCGCEVTAAPTNAQPWRIQICPGYIITPQGDEIEITKPKYFDLMLIGTEVFDPCASKMVRVEADTDVTIHVAVCYEECSTRPVRIHPAGCNCGCDETGCEYTRTRDDFVLSALYTIPDSHQVARDLDAEWHTTIHDWLASSSKGPAPVPPCAPCPDECWVVLGSITLPSDRKTKLEFDEGENATRSYEWRRVLYSTSTIYQMM